MVILHDIAVHGNPYDGVEIFKDMGCKWTIRIHFGTLVLAEEDALEQPKLLKKALTRSGIPTSGVFDM